MKKRPEHFYSGRILSVRYIRMLNVDLVQRQPNGHYPHQPPDVGGVEVIQGVIVLPVACVLQAINHHMDGA
jgi:hypothetical protein